MGSRLLLVSLAELVVAGLGCKPHEPAWVWNDVHPGFCGVNSQSIAEMSRRRRQTEDKLETHATRRRRAPSFKLNTSFGVTDPVEHEQWLVKISQQSQSMASQLEGAAVDAALDTGAAVMGLVDPVMGVVGGIMADFGSSIFGGGSPSGPLEANLTNFARTLEKDILQVEDQLQFQDLLNQLKADYLVYGKKMSTVNLYTKQSHLGDEYNDLEILRNLMLDHVETGLYGNQAWMERYAFWLVEPFYLHSTYYYNAAVMEIFAYLNTTDANRQTACDKWIDIYQTVTDWLETWNTLVSRGMKARLDAAPAEAHCECSFVPLPFQITKVTYTWKDAWPVVTDPFPAFEEAWEYQWYGDKQGFVGDVTDGIASAGTYHGEVQAALDAWPKAMREALESMVKSARASVQQCLPFKVVPVTAFDVSYADHGTGAYQDLALWRPRLTEGQFYVGDVCSGYEQPGKSFVLELGTDKEALAEPVSMRFEWNSKLTGGQEGGFFTPECPTGYVALGSVGEHQWSNDDLTPLPYHWPGLRCIRAEYTEEWAFAKVMWRETGSGGSYEGEVFTGTVDSYFTAAAGGYRVQLAGPCVGRGSHAGSVQGFKLKHEEPIISVQGVQSVLV